ncbi:PQQ-dependent sugar dehydrogenase [Salibacterium qingdaonense]|uniref:Glucose/arabinose dehydrogenase, beta-propeller fold n=1 Tax=Salibacterium qingdaonense TaxID=266892 RepID=A0A1I4MBW2_9BACI|nr:PQQ-dependent sugar dehydrogenase [Salibacterium qingdaonense]SFM00678.1 Glucose/arabinose dehydrogenase, beta-propeller fold [Salibacterium qingdaonense]
MKKIIAAGSVMILLGACSPADNEEEPDSGMENGASSGPETDSGDEPTDGNTIDDASSALSAETIASGLNVPWDVEVHQNSFYITERGGTIVHVNENGEKERQNIELNEPVAASGEGGLLGFELAPDFAQSQEAWVYHTYEEDQSLSNRIVSVTLENGTWQEQDVLVDGIPGGAIHNGGRLKLGPDDMLYATAGDAGRENAAQNRDSKAGSILRMTQEGNVPDDNPFEGSYIYSYGHRNPQGISWNENGEMYSSEHGSNARDEINRIEAGANYGWPEITGNESAENMRAPLVHSGSDTWAPSGTTFGESGAFYVTGLRGTQLMRFDVENESMEVVFSGQGRLRDVLQHDGSLYVITNNTDGRGNPGKEDDLLLRLNGSS